MQRPYEGSYYWGPRRPRESRVFLGMGLETKVILPAKLLARLHNCLLSWSPTHKRQGGLGSLQRPWGDCQAGRWHQILALVCETGGCS